MDNGDGYIQIGVTALRDPATGGFLPSVPLYIRATDEALASQERMFDDFARMAAKMIHKEREHSAQAQA